MAANTFSQWNIYCDFNNIVILITTIKVLKLAIRNQSNKANLYQTKQSQAKLALSLAQLSPSLFVSIFGWFKLLTE